MADQELKKIVIRTRINNEFRFIVLDHDHFTFDEFMVAGKKKIFHDGS